MKTLTWSLGGGLVVANLLVACATGGGDAGPPMARGEVTAPPLCTGRMEEVLIDPRTLGPTTGTIKVNPGEAHVEATGGGVRWKFNQNSYAFTSDGVTFKPAQPAGPTSAPATGDRSVFVWCFDNTSSMTKGTWHYTIKFTELAAPTKVWSCDPTIINRSSLATAVQTVPCTSPP